MCSWVKRPPHLTADARQAGHTLHAAHAAPETAKQAQRGVSATYAILWGALEDYILQTPCLMSPGACVWSTDACAGVRASRTCRRARPAAHGRARHRAGSNCRRRVCTPRFAARWGRGTSLQRARAPPPALDALALPRRQARLRGAWRCCRTPSEHRDAAPLRAHRRMCAAPRPVATRRGPQARLPATAPHLQDASFCVTARDDNLVAAQNGCAIPGQARQVAWLVTEPGKPGRRGAAELGACGSGLHAPHGVRCTARPHAHRRASHSGRHVTRTPRGSAEAMKGAAEQLHALRSVPAPLLPPSAAPTGREARAPARRQVPGAGQKPAGCRPCEPPQNPIQSRAGACRGRRACGGSRRLRGVARCASTVSPCGWPWRACPSG